MREHSHHTSSPASRPVEDFSKYCRDIPDFPKKGIIFKDITNLLKNGPVFKRAIDEIARHYNQTKVDAVISIEARGFIIGSALAYCLGSGMVPVRKKGKLPWKVYRKTYDLEYGQDSGVLEHRGPRRLDICPHRGGHRLVGRQQPAVVQRQAQSVRCLLHGLGGGPDGGAADLCPGRQFPVRQL